MRIAHSRCIPALVALGMVVTVSGCGDGGGVKSSPSSTVADETSELALANACLRGAGVTLEATESEGQIEYPPLEPGKSAQVQTCVQGADSTGGPTTTVAPDVLETGRRAMAEALVDCAAKSDIAVTLDDGSGLEFEGAGFAWKTSKADRRRADYQEVMDKCNLVADAAFKKVLADGS